MNAGSDPYRGSRGRPAGSISGIPEETNPIMGNRGIRLCLDRKKCLKHSFVLFTVQVPMEICNLMYPMITSEDEMDEIEKLIREVKKGLDEKNIPYKNIRPEL